MTSDANLLALARFAGIASTYVDAFGSTQRTPERTIRAILGVMGFDASSEEAATRTLAAVDERGWRRRLAPVEVVLADAPVVVAYALPASEAATPHRWSILTEDGASIEGGFVPADLPIVGTAEIDGARYDRRRLALEAPVPLGYHELRVRAAGATFTATIIVSPGRCHVPAVMSSEHGVWGLAVQLYGIRSARNLGIGDFTDLAELVRIVHRAGGAAVGVNPLHDLDFSANPSGSPYSPSSRTSLGWHDLDVARLPGFDDADLDLSGLADLRSAPYVDYASFERLVAPAVRAAFDRFESDGASEETRAFRRFVDDGGELARDTAIFGALRRFLRGRGVAGLWQSWPEALRDRRSPAVAAFAAEHATEVRFEHYVQWQAELQLAEAAAAAPLSVGLYRDLAVGAMPGGAETWAGAGRYRAEIAIGAPPDILNRGGQNWGIAPFDPNALRDAAYRPFVDLLRANMRHAGALRIDHVMALARLYWIPAGFEPSEGAYVAYDTEALLAIVALESVRAECLVVGEDLGTVPAGFRERMERANILSYRLLTFETNADGSFVPPGEYPELALVATATHDLPTIASYVTATDIDLRERLAGSSDGFAEQRAARAAAVASYADALARSCGDAAAERVRRLATSQGDASALAGLARDANVHLASTPSRLLVVPLEDVAGDVDQANLPGAHDDEHPNWRRRATIPLEELGADPRFRAIACALRNRRVDACPPARDRDEDGNP